MKKLLESGKKKWPESGKKKWPDFNGCRTGRVSRGLEEKIRHLTCRRRDPSPTARAIESGDFGSGPSRLGEWAVYLDSPIDSNTKLEDNLLKEKKKARRQWQTQSYFFSFWFQVKAW